MYYCVDEDDGLDLVKLIITLIIVAVICFIVCLIVVGVCIKNKRKK